MNHPHALTAAITAGALVLAAPAAGQGLMAPMPAFASGPLAPKSVASCHGAATWAATRTRHAHFPFRATTTAIMRCSGRVVYSCTARLQLKLGGRWRTMARRRKTARFGIPCIAPATQKEAVSDHWRVLNTYRMVILDRALWAYNTRYCKGAGTPVARCRVTWPFRTGERNSIVLR